MNNLFGDKQLENWTWEEYFRNKEELGDKIILVDVLGYPTDNSIPISENLFDGKYVDSTIFALYCHSGITSVYLQMQLIPSFPNYRFVNITGGILAL